MARRKRPKDLDLEIDDPDVGKDRGVAPTQTQTKKKSKLTAEERSAQAAEKKREREKEKEARKEQRRREKEERAQLKSLEVDLAEVNKRQSNRKESALELIVDLPVSFDASLKTLVDSAFSAAGVETSYVDSVVPGLITFRRKLAREWDAQTKSFRRIPLRIEPEPYVLCVLKAKQLAQLVWDDVNGDKAVDEFAKKINANFSGFEQVYIIEGLQQYLRSNANRANREFAQRVRGALNQVSASAPQQQPHRQQQQRSRATPDVSGEQIEDRLDHLQMEYYAKIIHTSTASETTLEIQRFAEHISAVRHAPE
ncbi:putative monocarboxylate transporter mch1, partial [Ascosphaera atra]